MRQEVELVLWSLFGGLFALGAIVGTTASCVAMIRLRKNHCATWETLGGLWWSYRLTWYFWSRRHKQLTDPILDSWATLTVAGQAMALIASLALIGLLIWSERVS